MRVWYDGVIWSRQVMGGVNRYFTQVINGLPADIEPLLTVESPRDMHFPENPRQRVFPCTREGQGIISWVECEVMHPTYYELLSHSDIRCARSPVVLTVHDMLHELFPELADPGGEQREWKRTLIPQATHLICVSHNTKRDVMRLLGVPASRISVVHHATNLSVERAVGASAPAGPPYFLYVGHRYGYKNVTRLLEAFALVRRRWSKVRLHFTGAPFTEPEKRRMDALGLASSVVSVGYVPEAELAALYKSAVALVYPSLYEGFGFPLLEAMACECPVIASDTSSLPEVAGDAAVYVEPEDTEAWAQAMLRLLEDKPLRRELITRGKLRAGLFSWEKTVSETVAVYRALAAGAGAA